MALEPKPIERLDESLCGRLIEHLILDNSKVWFVGGAVRDVLIGRQPREIDLLTTESATEIATQMGELVESHERFGTAKARVDSCVFDIAQARTETYEAPGALPSVKLDASIAEDLARRDFTINAIALTFQGELIEHPGAQRDLKAGVIRVLHGRSFIDDPTRLWRLVRYSVRLGFRIESQTSQYAVAAVAGGALDTVSGDRIGSELRLALIEPDPLATLHAAQNLGLTPKLNLDPAVIGAALEILPAGARADLLILGAAISDVKWVGELGFTADDLAVVRACVSAPDAPDAEPSEIATALRGLPDEAVALSGARGNRQAAERWLLELRHVELEISGEDLIEAGVPKGPEIGERLERALEMKLDGKINGHAAELAAAVQ